MKHHRNFGLLSVTSRPASGAQPLTGSHYRAQTPRETEFRLPSEGDKDFAALCFALFGLTLPFVIGGFAFAGWFLFID